MRPSVVVVLSFVAACSEPAPVGPGFALRAVVAPRLAELEARVPAEVVAPEVDAAAVAEELEAVLGPLRSSDARMRELALEDARALSPAALRALAARLGAPDETPEVQNGIAAILAARPEPFALEALVAAVETGAEGWLRAQCAYQLGRGASDAFVLRLLLRLKYEKDHEAAFWIADALARHGHLAGLEAMLVVWSQAADGNLRASAEARLLELANGHGLTDAAELVRRWRAGTLGVSEPVEPSARLELEAWRWIARLGEWSLRTVDDARFTLSRAEAWIVPRLAEALHDPDVYVRQHVAQCLERMGPRGAAAAPTLVLALTEPTTAPAAATALGALGVRAAAGALEQHLETSLDPELCVAAARALGQLGAPSSAALLARLFAESTTPDLRQALAEAWLALADAPAALQHVHACLTDERADAGTAEHVLAAWLARRAPQDPAAAETQTRWLALEPAPGALPSEAELRQRRRARAELLAPLVVR